MPIGATLGRSVGGSVGRSAECAGGQDADGNDTHVMRGSPIDQLPVVLERERRRRWQARSRVDQVETRLHVLRAAQIDGLVEHVGISESIDAVMAHFALLPELLECGQHGLDVGETYPATGCLPLVSDDIVQLDQVDPVASQAP